MNKPGKMFLALTLVTLIAVAGIVAVSSAFGQPAWADPADWYATVKGVLHSDRYTLYPYLKKSLNIGFSKFGEMINALPTQRLGLEYDGRDPLAPPAGSSEPANIPQRKWFSGWLINITYTHATASPTQRCVWAVAMHASIDTTTYGNAWVRVDKDYVSVAGGKIAGSNTERCEDPNDPGWFLSEDGLTVIPGAANGGRKTNGSAVTLPIKVLYDGPRRYVAQLETVISDVLDDTVSPMIIEPLVKLVFTIDFNKVKKEVNVIKDVKLLFVKFQYGVRDITSNGKTPHDGYSGHNEEASPGTTAYQGMYVQFSNRGEWDLGPEPTFDSYVHFYTDGPGENKTATAPQLNPTYEGLATVYNREYALIRTAPPNVNARWGIEPDSKGCLETYDLAQIISSDLRYVGFAAFWPSLSDWSVDGVTDDLYWRSLTNASIHREDCRIEPFTSPFIIGEWDFILTPAPFYDPDTKVEGDIQFRGVTVYGVTDLNKGINGAVGDNIDLYDPADSVPVGDGDDANRISGASNIVDREVYYQLGEVFRPWDLKKAVTKAPPDARAPDDCPICSGYEPERHVIKVAGTNIQSIQLTATSSTGDHRAARFHSPAYYSAIDGIIGDDDEEVGEWYAYSSFAERVLVNDVLLVRGKDYKITDRGSDDGLDMVLEFKTEKSGVIKVLYSVDLPAYEWISVGRNAIPGVEPLGALQVDSIAAGMVTQAFDSLKDISVQWSALDIADPWHRTVPSLMRRFTAGDARANYYYSPTDGRLALKDDWSTSVPVASSGIISVGGPIANMVTEYFNEFTPVVGRTMPERPGTYLQDLLAVSDWLGNRGDDVSSSDYNTVSGVAGPKSWAVVATYKDINGTVGFIIWGLTGNDTYWASQAMYNTGFLPWKPGLEIYKEIRCDSPTLGGNGNGDIDSKDPLVRVPLAVIKYLLHHERWTLENISLELTAPMIGKIIDAALECHGTIYVPLIEFLQEENCGVTAIILEIDYSTTTAAGDFHPKITIVEELGTKTEKPQHPDP